MNPRLEGAALSADRPSECATTAVDLDRELTRTAGAYLWNRVRHPGRATECELLGAGFAALGSDPERSLRFAQWAAAVDRAPDSATFFFDLLEGRALSRLRRYVEAEAAFARARVGAGSMDRMGVGGLLDWGGTLTHLGRPTEALDAYLTAIRQIPVAMATRRMMALADATRIAQQLGAVAVQRVEALRLDRWDSHSSEASGLRGGF